MSWLSDLAGKAESLLEKVDNTAATALQRDEKAEQKDVNTREEPEQSHDEIGYEPRISRTASEGSLLRPGPTAPIKARPPSTSRPHSKQSRKDSKDDDQQLFEFLNSNVPTSKPKRSNTPSPSLTRKTPEPLSSIVADRIDGKKTQVETTEDPKDKTDEDKGPHLSLDLASNKEPVVQTINHESPSQPAPAVNHPEQDRNSNLELENKLLRKEVASLNEEMVYQLQRAKDAEKSKKTLKKYVCEMKGQHYSTYLLIRTCNLRTC
ncbi:golgin subfamily A member 5 [Exaiptasia diaphana]|uniref:Golgin-84 n=1 Tax=Exaiptasia diaphana TaxID=2652724 RepID=A0A913Y5K9_EXADI|nr:golgin subfamily A member 5 [Exaiptasia diaphana]